MGGIESSSAFMIGFGATIVGFLDPFLAYLFLKSVVLGFPMLLALDGGGGVFCVMDSIVYNICLVPLFTALVGGLFSGLQLKSDLLSDLARVEAMLLILGDGVAIRGIKA